MKRTARFLVCFLLIAPRLLIAQNTYPKITTTAPVAFFSAADTAICGGYHIESFTDLSTNNPVSWKWYFPGAIPDTSTLKNPTNISYSGYGCYTVKLVVKNGSGSDSLTDSNYICLDAPIHIRLSGNGHICKGGGSDTITASGGSHYRWSSGATTSSIIITPPVSITFTLKVSDGACFKDTDVTIIVDTMPIVTLKGDTSICIGDSTTVYASKGYGYRYLWCDGSTSDSILRRDIKYSFTCPVVVTNGACQITRSITVDVHNCIQGVVDYFDPIGIETFPNPANNQLSVIMKKPLNTNGVLTITDIIGRQVYYKLIKPNQSQVDIDISSLLSSTYFLMIQTKQGVIVKKFVKN